MDLEKVKKIINSMRCHCYFDDYKRRRPMLTITAMYSISILKYIKIFKICIKAVGIRQNQDQSMATKYKDDALLQKVL